MMENRNGHIVDARLTEANGTAERTTALDMIEDNAKPGSTVGGDKNYDTADFIAGCRERGCTPRAVDENGGWPARDPASRAQPGGMVLWIDGNGIQSDSPPENPRGNGMSLSGVSDMRQKDSRSCACGAVDHPFVLLPPIASIQKFSRKTAARQSR
jgi:hypothetical protein